MTAGTIALALSIAPSTKSLTIKEAPISGGLFRLTRLPNGQLRAEVIETEGSGSRRIVWSTVSRPIIALKPRPIVLIATWSDAGLSFEVDGETVASTDPATALPVALILGDIKPLDAVEDFADRNAACVTARKELLANTPIWADRRYPGKDFDLERLHKERAALSDFLRAVPNGATHHDLSIAKSVRTLLIPVKGRGQMGLLQRCAAHLHAELIVYTIKQPSLRPPITPGLMLYVSVSGTPEDIFTNPVDIDAWLELPSAFVVGREYTNGELIKTIGDTRAAHADPGLHVLVEALEAMRSDVGHGGAGQNFLTHTMVQIGQAVASATDNLLAKAGR